MPVCVVAEAGVNHNGDPALARRLVEAAADAGADVVKFQTFDAKRLATAKAAKADYQQKATAPGESQLDMLRRLELSHDSHVELMALCAKRGIGFLSTPFDLESLAFLTDDLGLDTLKISSGDLTNGPLLLAAARSGCRVILSTGMGTLDEIRDALGVLAFGYANAGSPPSIDAFRTALESGAGRDAVAQRVTVLHCTSAYPAPFGDLNLRAIETLRREFGIPVGLSDHSTGVIAPIAAVALGATTIEKHFTLDRGLPGPDHAASLLPDELASMVRNIRDIEAALGDGDKRPTPSETPVAIVARKVIVAATPIKEGETLDEHNLTVKRAGNGLSPMQFWGVIGTRAARAFEPDEPVTV